MTTRKPGEAAPTPRTDAFRAKSKKSLSFADLCEAVAELVDSHEQLERELAALRKQHECTLGVGR